MKYLLDTHSLIWFFAGHPNLSNKVREIMEDDNHQKLISLVSVWEMGIKQSKGKFNLFLPLEDYINNNIKLEDFDLLPIKLNHVSLITSLPFHHNDPFDRLLIAQSIIENIPILSKDIAFDAYDVNRLW
ncbi:type II toxin-antitoxin system VapC family toxin [Crocosphaera sp.]|uniref:type II toxin-antitoxin system VapC family toxin n=1 Tax=Crocosphaera sp. TaxID=2729996 RepID=UPI0025797FEA|nr:type II toxin-antitoxin system VapC family toxin [Crocosphaera sp.]NQZ64637.1 type II toxin-antitoxin system VapC family toxin [Crocosphaera sp.]